MNKDLYSRVAIGLMFVGMLMLSGCMTMSGHNRIDNIPMYGQPTIVRPDILKKADEDFIKAASEGFGGNREAASAAWAAQANSYLGKGNLDYAMRRYNQSWLLNPNNYQAYWGFGRILDLQGYQDHALEYLEKAKSLVHDRFQEPALLADTGIVYHNLAMTLPDGPERTKFFIQANKHFQRSTEIDPTYATAWSQWAGSLFFQGNYLAAWEKVKKAQGYDKAVVSDDLLKDLRNKMPEPQ